MDFNLNLDELAEERKKVPAKPQFFRIPPPMIFLISVLVLFLVYSLGRNSNQQRINNNDGCSNKHLSNRTDAVFQLEALKKQLQEAGNVRTSKEALLSQEKFELQIQLSVLKIKMDEYGKALSSLSTLKSQVEDNINNRDDINNNNNNNIEMEEMRKQTDLLRGRVQRVIHIQHSQLNDLLNRTQLLEVQLLQQIQINSTNDPSATKDHAHYSDLFASMRKEADRLYLQNDQYQQKFSLLNQQNMDYIKELISDECCSCTPPLDSHDCEKGYMEIKREERGGGGFESAEAEIKIDADADKGETSGERVDLARGGEVVEHSFSFVPPAGPGLLDSNFDLSQMVSRWLGLEDVGRPEEALHESLRLGRCWGMSGQEGYLTVKLQRSIIIEAITIVHVSSKLIEDNRSSAPKNFKIFGITETGVGREDLLLIGSFPNEYEDGDDEKASELKSSKTFEIPRDEQIVVDMVKLEITSNHGEDYTCLYRFQVHGRVVG